MRDAFDGDLDNACPNRRSRGRVPIEAGVVRILHVDQSPDLGAGSGQTDTDSGRPWICGDGELYKEFTSEPLSRTEFPGSEESRVDVALPLPADQSGFAHTNKYAHRPGFLCLKA